MDATGSSEKAADGGKRPRGRPQARPDSETRHVVLAAATREFLECGYDATSMDAVARRAGVAKRTIYRFWATKADLLADIIVERRENALPALDPERLDRLGLRRGLEEMLGQLAHLILSDEAVGLYRLVSAEALNFPEVATAFYREGPARSHALVARHLERQQRRGRLRLDDPATAATMLVNMATAEPFRMAALGLSGLPQDIEIDARVKLAVALFLDGCGVSEAD